MGACVLFVCGEKKKKNGSIYLTSNLSQMSVLFHFILWVVVCDTGMTLVRTIKKRHEWPHL